MLKKKKFQCERQGLTIRGFYYSPRKLNHKTQTIIISHGFACSTIQTKSYAKEFAKKGYLAYVFDFCGSGSGKSDGDSTKMSPITEALDLCTVLDYVKQQEFVDSKQIVLAGCSQGGFVSAIVSAQRPEEVSKLIMYYPALCIPDDAKRGNMLGTEFDPNNVPETFMAVYIKLGKCFVQDAQTLEPWKEICTYTKPVLIIHGDMDRVVDVSYAKTAAQKYSNAKLCIIEGGDHGFIIKGFKESIKESLEFLK